MFFRSLFWERTVLSLLEKVQQLPANVQTEIAKRVGSYIDIASMTHEEGSLERFATAAVEERQRVIAQGVKSPVDQRWAAPAFAEAWCVARLGLYNGSLSRNSAMAVIVAVETFALKGPAYLTKGPPKHRPSSPSQLPEDNVCLLEEAPNLFEVDAMNVRSGSKADIRSAEASVCFVPLVDSTARGLKPRVGQWVRLAKGNS
jgi:hypothetical protein